MSYEQAQDDASDATQSVNELLAQYHKTVDRLTLENDSIWRDLISCRSAAYRLGQLIEQAFEGLPYAPTHGCFYSDKWFAQMADAVRTLRAERDAALMKGVS